MFSLDAISPSFLSIPYVTVVTAVVLVIGLLETFNTYTFDRYSATVHEYKKKIANSNK